MTQILSDSVTTCCFSPYWLCIQRFMCNTTKTDQTRQTGTSGQIPVSYKHYPQDHAFTTSIYLNNTPPATPKSPTKPNLAVRKVSLPPLQTKTLVTPTKKVGCPFCHI